MDSQAKRLLNTSVGSNTADTSTENEEESKFRFTSDNFITIAGFDILIILQTLNYLKQMKNCHQHLNSS